ncbi:MAG: glycosyltransferase family 2 protein [Methanosarcina sp.]|uniref:glycosyltransferase family 2 protein n=1 Tax=Methanosarcina sp. TaxID=2213 RepID=UPI003BB5E6B8
MINELPTGKNFRCMTKQEEHSCTRGKVPQNITVVLPAHNEESSIGSVILLTRLYANNVVVVDDGSSDRTGEIAKKAGATVLVHNTSRGKGIALETGFKAAAELGADIIVTMDSEGRHDPEDIPRLVAQISQGHADIVNGSRYLNGLGNNTPFYRRIGQTILERFTSINSASKITDPQSGFLAFAASVKDVFRFNAQGIALENELLADAGKSGLHIKEVEIGVYHHVEDQLRNPIKYILGVMETVVKDIEVNRPLYFYSVPGFALITCGLYMGFKFLEAFFLGIESLHFGPAFLMVFLALAGVYMTISGIVINSLAEVTGQTEPAL